MYIPPIFTNNPNGCPSGFRAYKMGNWTTTNLNTGARGRITVNINRFTNDVVGENYQGLGDYLSNIQLNNGISYGADGLEPPSGISNTALPFFGSTGQNQTLNYYITSSAGEQLYYCYDCTKRYRWTIASNACQVAPWPQFATPLTLAVLLNPTGSLTTDADYNKVTFNFCTGTTATIDGYGPIWQRETGGNNAASYYIVSRQDITPTKYNIQNCLTGATASIQLSGSQTLSAGNSFRAVGAGLTGSCWSVLNSFQNDLIPATYTNVVTSSTFVDCDTCLGLTKYNITNCYTSQSFVATFTGSVPSIGTTFKTYTPGIDNTCFTLDSSASVNATIDYSRMVVGATFANCSDCNSSIDYLIVAGGGGGGTTAGGGGGAGGYVASSISIQSIQPGSYPVVVGNGGAVATNGENSSIFGVTSIGGGFGGYGTTTFVTGSVGGSGGGGTGDTSITSGSLGTAGQGFAGGLGREQTGNNQSAGGGGGASQNGANYSNAINGGAGAGGIGTQWVDGNFYAGGGGGSYSGTGDRGGAGGAGGGGRGAADGIISATNGEPNTGGGGGGGSNVTFTAGTGGSGIVKLRYESGSVMGATGGSISVVGQYVYHTFTGSGTFTL